MISSKLLSRSIYFYPKTFNLSGPFFHMPMALFTKSPPRVNFKIKKNQSNIVQHLQEYEPQQFEIDPQVSHILQKLRRRRSPNIRFIQKTHPAVDKEAQKSNSAVLRFILKALSSRPDELSLEEGESKTEKLDDGLFDHDIPEGKITDEGKEYDHPLTKKQFLFCISRAKQILELKFKRDYQYHLKIGENDQRVLAMTTKASKLIEYSIQICKSMNYTGLHSTEFYDDCYLYLQTLGQYTNFEY